MKRDNQRKKVYDWTRFSLRPLAGLTSNQKNDPQLSTAEVTELVIDICQDFGVPCLEIKFSGRLTSIAGQVTYYSRYEAAERGIGGPTLYGGLKPRLELSTNGGMNLLTILHEMAHYLTSAQWGTIQVAQHGPEFLGCLLELLETYAGLDRTELVKSLYGFEVTYYKRKTNPNTGIRFLEKATRRVSVTASNWRNPRGWAGFIKPHPELAHHLVGA